MSRQYRSALALAALVTLGPALVAQMPPGLAPVPGLSKVTTNGPVPGFKPGGGMSDGAASPAYLPAPTPPPPPTLAGVPPIGLPDMPATAAPIGQVPNPVQPPTVPTLAPTLNIGPSNIRPAVQVEVLSPETVQFGEPLRYEIVVRNSGPTAVTDVKVEQTLSGATYIGGQPRAEAVANKLVWAVGNLDAGAERRISANVKPTGDSDFRAAATVSFAAACGITTKITRPHLIVTMSCPDTVLVGDAVPFAIRITNDGSGPAQQVTLRDKLPDGLTHPQGSLIEAELGTFAPGQSRSITLTATAARVGTLTSELIATAAGGLEITAKSVVKVLEPKIALKQTGPTTGYLRSEAVFQLEVSNPGSAPAGNVVVAEVLPAGLEFVSAAEGGSYDTATRTVTWLLPQLPAGGQKLLGVKTKAAQPGEWVCQGRVKAERNLTAQAETKLHLEGVPALSMEVVDLEDPIEVNGETTYEIRVLNQGSCPCSNIRIVADLPPGLAAVSAAGPGPFAVQGSQIAFEPHAKLATKADLVYRMRTKGIGPGDVRFRVTMTCDQLKSPVVKEESTRIYKP